MRFLLLLVFLAACTEFSTSSAALSDDPVSSCPVVDATAIAGNEATFYVCAEETLQCGPSGYPIGYGKKYAERYYRKTRPWMSSAGKQWIDDVLVCLQEELRASIDSETSCADVRTIAFDTHPDCYLAAGFCELPFLDWLAVFAAIDPSDWFSADFVRQVHAVANSCL